MEYITGLLLISIVLLNFRMLFTNRIMTCIQSIALQALLFGLLSLYMNRTNGLLVILSLTAVTLIKAALIPWLVRRTTLRVGVKRELEPFVGYALSTVIGAGMLGLSIVIARQLPLPSAMDNGFFVPIAFFTILTGLFLIVARKKAVTQVLGYLALENGIYAFGMSFPIGEPLIIEMGILLDIFAAIFIMGITIYHINREFDHIDIDRLADDRGGKS